jgi:hypothetical protein
MTQVFAERLKGAKPEFPDTRAGKRAKARSTRKRGKGYTKAK